MANIEFVSSVNRKKLATTYDHIEAYDSEKIYSKNIFEADFGYGSKQYIWVLFEEINSPFPAVVVAKRFYTIQVLKQYEAYCSCPCCLKSKTYIGKLYKQFHTRCEKCYNCIKNGLLFANEEYIKYAENACKSTSNGHHLAV